MKRLLIITALLACVAGVFTQPGVSVEAQDGPDIYAKKNLVAWCIVPFDSKKRSPAERAEMIKRLGMSKVAYDWRNEHVASFEEEILQYKKHGIDFFAFWSWHDAMGPLIRKHKIHPQIWITCPSAGGATQAEKVAAAAKRMLPDVERTRSLGCKLGLYNHGGWGGEPVNLAAVCKYLREHHQAEHVGIVYNFHHGHAHIANFKAALHAMRPYLLCLNLNGMADAENVGGVNTKILPLGAGQHEASMMRLVRESGYRGPIGILNHTNQDAEGRLQDNLDGLKWLLPQLDGKPAGKRPNYRTWRPPPPRALDGGQVFQGRGAYRNPPLTVECRVTLRQQNTYNILVACDEKRSAAHWEIFSNAGTGHLTAYLPGHQPDHVRSDVAICDYRPHTITMIYEPTRVRLFVDSKQVADQVVTRSERRAAPGGLAIGRLVEGNSGCYGAIAWVRISRGVRNVPEQPPDRVEADATTLRLWKFSEVSESHTAHASADSAPLVATPPYDADRVATSVAESRQQGMPERGAAVFAAAKFACLSCHKIGNHGGTIGPDLTDIGKQRTGEQIVESIYWPQREIKPEFALHTVLTVDGNVHRGYQTASDDEHLVLRDPATDRATRIARDAVEETLPGTSLMPDGLTGAMSRQQQLDLIRFLSDLGRDGSLPADTIDAVLSHSHGHAHGPAHFPIDKAPLHKEHWPSWQHPVNRDRLYDFYAKQAIYFGKQEQRPSLIPAYPGLDGGTFGHWGNQDEAFWANDRWNDTQLGSVQGGIFHGAGVTVARGVCLQLGDQGELSTCFNPDTLTYDALWSGGFVKFSSVRSGFLHGLELDGTPLPRPKSTKPDKPFQYHGFYRHGRRVVFAYRIGKTEYLDAPWVKDGQFSRVVATADEHPQRHLVRGGPAQWPERLPTHIVRGTGRPYAVDTIELPYDNRWKVLLFCGGHDFLPNGDALVCTMQGDVWRARGLVAGRNQTADRRETVHWQRFASGLHHALGLVVADDGIYVQCRDQIMRLHDLNNDGEADFYECFSNAPKTSAAGHDFICGLQRDSAGNFYTASGPQGLVRVSADGKRAEVLATGLRNPDGLGLYSDGTVTVPSSEGGWTPASMICAVRPSDRKDRLALYFGYGGPRDGNPPDLPLVYLPRGLDNSSGGQAYISSDRWGPLQGQLLHFSFGAGTHFLILRDEVDGQLQGAAVPLVGEFLSGAHRGRFNPRDGQLYVSGMQGWGSFTPDDGCFHRVRYTGDRVQLPRGFHVHQNGVTVTFSEPIDQTVAQQARNHFAQCWNYRYSQAYGSAEYSPRHPGTSGHDPLAIRSAHVLADGRTLFLELPDLQPVSQLHLRLRVEAGAGQDLFLTVHKLGEPLTDFPGYRPTTKTIAAHPMLSDLALATKRVPNPWRQPIADARELTLETGKNLTFASRTLTATAGELLRLTLSNPDVVPHNWALLKPGTLRSVGEQANRLIADPEAAARQYIPRSSDVLVYTDVVPPKKSFSIYFRVPDKPGRYPYLCTFPGHWMVMNGALLVTAPRSAVRLSSDAAPEQ